MLKKIIIIIAVLFFIILIVITCVHFSTRSRIQRVINKLPDTQEIVVRSPENAYKITDDTIVEEIINILSNAVLPNCNLFKREFHTLVGSALRLDMINTRGHILTSIDIFPGFDFINPQNINNFCGRATIDTNALINILEEINAFGN